MRYFQKLGRPQWRDQAGITGLETAIVLIAFVVVSSVFAFAALSTGLFTADKSKETIQAGLEEARGTLELKGSVLVKEAGENTGDVVNEISFTVANAAGGQFVAITPGRTIIKYSDKNQSVIFGATGDSFAFVVDPLGNADNDNLVETGEIYKITLKHLAGSGDGARTGLTTTLKTGDTFQVEMIPPHGAVLLIERTLPITLTTFTDLG